MLNLELTTVHLELRFEEEIYACRGCYFSINHEF